MVSGVRNLGFSGQGLLLISPFSPCAAKARFHWQYVSLEIPKCLQVKATFRGAKTGFYPQVSGHSSCESIVSSPSSPRGDVGESDLDEVFQVRVVELVSTLDSCRWSMQIN